jgi:hypothetical protein
MTIHRHERTNKIPWQRYLKLLALVLLTSITPLIMYWSYNLGQVRPGVVIDPMLVILLCTFLLFNAILVILRSLAKSALMVLLMCFVIFTYGHVAQMLPSSGPSSGIFLLLVYGLVFLAGSILIFSRKKISGNVFFFFSVVIAILLVINAVHIIKYDPHLTTETKAAAVPAQATLDLEKKPDVYFIVLDAYARDDILREVYGYDNSAFLQALSDRGFFIPDCAWSNYDSTYDAMASVLNMNYLDTMGMPNASLSVLSASQTELILNNQARQTFKDLGYQFVTARGFGSFNDIQNSDIYLNYYQSQGKKDQLEEDSFIYLFLQTTLFRAVDRLQPAGSQPSTDPVQTAEVNPDNLAYQESLFWYDQTKYVFDSLEELSQEPGNFFVYAHVNSPHGPYVFNRDGSFRFEPDLSNESALYIDTIIYLNQHVLDLVDTIIANSDTPPVIILQADHGTHYYVNGPNKHKILSAYYLPGDVDVQPYATITPVNDFRLVLHDYFDPSIQLLPDTLYVMRQGGYQSEPAACDLP